MEVSFTVQTIDCVACIPLFSRSLSRVEGVLGVRELPITNKVIVAFDGTRVERAALVREIRRVSEKAGYSRKIIFQQTDKV